MASRAEKCLVSFLSFHSGPAVDATAGRPSVMVPVLSSTIVSMFFAVSRLSASLMSMLSRAPRPTPTISAVGVASPRAQGQAMMSTVAMARRPLVRPSVGARMSQAASDRREIAMMMGTKIAATLSTSLCTGALLPWAWRTSSIIFERRVFLPMVVAWIVMAVVPLLSVPE